MDILIDKGWLPDLTPNQILATGGLKVAKNIIPVNGYYKPTYRPSVLIDTVLDGTPVSGYVGESEGEYRSFIGTNTSIYELVGGSVIDRTRIVSGNKVPYSSNTSYWSFEIYGSWIVATNFHDNVQVLKDSSTFNDLGGSPPKAKYALFKNGHLILANLIEGSSLKPKKIRWSAKENIEDWTPSLITGSDYQEFPQMQGQITGIAHLGDSFIITSEWSVTIGYYVGGSWTFQFKEDAYKNVGCYYEGSLISIGHSVLFWGADAIYMMSSDGSIRNISEGRIKNAVFKNINTATRRISSLYDRNNNLIYWAYPSYNSDIFDMILVYSITEDKFTVIEIPNYLLISGSLSGGNQIESNAVLIDNTNDLIDFGQSSTLEVMLVNEDKKICSFTGDALDAEIETGEISNPTDVFMARSLIVNAKGSLTGSVTTQYRMSWADEIQSSASATLLQNGVAHIRTSGVGLRFNIKLNNFQYLTNPLRVDIIKTGGR